MDYKEYKIEADILEKEYKLKLHNLRKSYVEKNAEFKIGDFIYNVTGIIKVESMSYNIFEKSERFDIVYHGYRYKKAHGVLSRTKDKKISELTYSLKLIENPILK